AAITANGRMQLAGDYPLNAEASFQNLTYAGLRPLLGPDVSKAVDGSTAGELTISGPATRIEALRANLRLTRFEAHSTAPSAAGTRPRGPFQIHNEGPVVMALDRSVVTVQSARFTGTDTSLAISGTASIADPETLSLRANGNFKLDILEAFSPNIVSS